MPAWQWGIIGLTILLVCAALALILNLPGARKDVLPVPADGVVSVPTTELNVPVLAPTNTPAPVEATIPPGEVVTAIAATETPDPNAPAPTPNLPPPPPTESP
jgi:hypothetical protein